MRTWLILVSVIVAGGVLHPQEPLPKDWIDARTGHRIVRLTDDAGGSTLYFHDNAFSPEGDKMMFNTPNGIAMVDVATIGTAGAKLAVVAPRARGGYFARRSREIYYTTDGMVSAVNVDTRRTRDVANARGIINADETLSAVKNAAAVDAPGTVPRPPARAVVPQLQRMFPGRRMDDLTPDQRYSVTKEDGLAGRALNPSLQSFVFTNLKTGDSHETGFQYGDLNHLQFNPVDPGLLLYCHEGTWHELDRTWTIRTDGSQMRLMHQRTMDMEINGHEWWSFDGKTVWFDLQTPRSQDFWIAGVDMQGSRKIRYHLQRDWWGVHFNSSRDDTLFASDGGDPSQVAYAPDGMWINLLRVGTNETLTREKLVNMSAHNYVTGRGGVEPNAHITPDKRWVVFTGQFAPGQRHVYAVQVDPASAAPSAREPPREWIDPDTGHRVVRLSDEPGSQSLYFHQNAYTPDGRKLVITTPTGLSTIDLKTHAIQKVLDGHEFFSPDGRQIWYDLQTPRSEVFWLAGYELASGARTWYHLDRSEWSVHFNQSPDGTLFAGDGGGPSSVAAPGNGQWIYLFRPQVVADRTDHALPAAGDLIKPGVLKAEKLVNLARHDYSLEPNVTFTPDGHWIVFRSNLFGPTHVFAVDVNKPAGAAP